MAQPPVPPSAAGAAPGAAPASPAPASPPPASPPPASKVLVTLRVNGEPHQVAFAPHKTLLEVLREDLDLTGTKHGCELGECGTCAVLVDGVPVLSCLVLAVECADEHADGGRGPAIETVEGLAGATGPHPLQEAFADLGAAQCGYCTPGFLLTAKAVLARDPAPSRAALKDELSGNLCRCTGYLKIYEAVEHAAARLRGETTATALEAHAARQGAPAGGEGGCCGGR